MRERTAEASDPDASAGPRGAAVSRPAPDADIDPPLDIDGVLVSIARPKRVRSASDVIRLLIGTGLVALGIVLATVADDTVGGAQADLIDEVGRIPSRLQEAVIGVAQVLGASVVLAIVIVLVVRGEWRRLGVLFLGSIVATLAMHFVAEALELPETTRAIADNAVGTGWIDDPGFPSSGYLASSAAIVTLAGVWLSRRWKRALWAAVIALAGLRLLSSATGALDVVLAVAVGVVVGSLALGRVRGAEPRARWRRSRRAPALGRAGPANSALCCRWCRFARVHPYDRWGRGTSREVADARRSQRRLSRPLVPRAASAGPRGGAAVRDGETPYRARDARAPDGG